MSLSRTPAAKLLASALVVALVPTLAACGGSDDKDSGSGSSTASYPKIDAQPATGKSVEGTGYSYKLPNGWEDITSQLKATQPGVDSGGRATPPTDPFTANLNTLTTPNQVQDARPSLDDLKVVAAQIKKEIAPLSPDAKLLSPVSVDGVPTVRQEGPANNSGAKFYLEQYWMVTPGSSYGFTFAFPRSTSSAERDKVVGSVLASVKRTS